MKRSTKKLLARSSKKVRPATRRGWPVRLDTSTADGAEGPKWIQVAEAGQWNGHPSGPFEFNRLVFEQIIANFRAHPSYLAGPDGYGSADVVPFDFDHASEQDPTSGVLPVRGAPAQAWALDLEIRSVDGVDQLWALTRYLEPARTYVREGKYKWTSVAVWPEAKDPVTGLNVGWYLSSIAFTNDPFIQGMVPIAASMAYWNTDGAPQTATEVVDCMRHMFELPATSELGAVLAELGKLRVWSSSGGAPPGVDVPRLVGQLRHLFNLPVLSEPEFVFAEADKLLAMLAQEQAAAASQTLATADRAATKTKETSMKTLLELVAGRLGVPCTEDAVTKEIVIRLDKGESALKGLTAILSALGVQDVDAGAQKIASMFQQVKQLEEAMPELAALYQSKMTDEEAGAEKDVEEAMTSHRMPPEAKPAMLHMRSGGIELRGNDGQPLPREQLAKALDLRSTAKAVFLSKYPKQAQPPAQHAYLTQPTVTQPPAFGLVPQNQNGVALGAARGSQAPQLQGGPVNLDMYPGRNVTERAMAFVRANGGQHLSYDELHEQACRIVGLVRSQAMNGAGARI